MCTNEFLVVISVLDLCGSESRFRHPHRVLVSTGIVLNSSTYSSSSTHFLWFLHLSSLNDPFTHLCPNVSSVLCFRVPKQHQHNINTWSIFFHTILSSSHLICRSIANQPSSPPSTSTWLHNFRHPYQNPFRPTRTKHIFCRLSVVAMLCT